ncbi:MULTISPECIES: hypothetical protein [Catenuloplanes]|uniref:DUF2690 domain-containing protein n=1 Tax=Catenuloplanes niger TaxID=587534 RepID=A0AAE3ZY00_9ACTN|nr:hypothetical protein [Catenuloplanes niger]MDR7327961.1 hypothetical protein [Catenuloplanes niger]
MRVLRRLGTLAASAAVAATLIVGFPQAAQAAAWTCPAGPDAGVWDPALNRTPVPAVYVWNRKIELRYHTSTRCAWGRISNGVWGDQIWVDWAPTRGAGHTQLGVDSIPYGGTQDYTTAYNDAGHVMRACGKAHDRVEIACTGWY